MFSEKDKETLAEIMGLAREGHADAISFLRDKYALTVFTGEEVKRVNELRSEGKSLEQAIKQMRGEQDELQGSRAAIGGEVPQEVQVPQV
jgi:hypothetical protein